MTNATPPRKATPSGQLLSSSSAKGTVDSFATRTRTKRYPVAGMTCALCVRAVTSELSTLDGVRTVTVDLVPGGMSIVIVTGANLPRREHIAQAIAAAGEYHLMPR